MFNSISEISYIPPVYHPQSDFMNFFNQALSAGYSSDEAKKIAKKKIKEKKEQKTKDKKVEDSNKSDKTKHSIDRRV